MRSINKVVLIGNVTRDPVQKQTQSGNSVVTFGLATNREWMTQDGRRMKSAEFHDLVGWAKLGDLCFKHLKKGKLVYIEGYLKTRSWVDQTGLKKFRTEIVVQDMVMLEKRALGDTANEDFSAASAEQESSGAGFGDDGDALPAPDEGVFEG